MGCCRVDPAAGLEMPGYVSGHNNSRYPVLALAPPNKPGSIGCSCGLTCLSSNAPQSAQVETAAARQTTVHTQYVLLELHMLSHCCPALHLSLLLFETPHQEPPDCLSCS